MTFKEKCLFAIREYLPQLPQKTSYPYLNGFVSKFIACFDKGGIMDDSVMILVFKDVFVKYCIKQYGILLSIYLLQKDLNLTEEEIILILDFETSKEFYNFINGSTKWPSKTLSKFSTDYEKEITQQQLLADIEEKSEIFQAIEQKKFDRIMESLNLITDKIFEVYVKQNSQSQNRTGSQQVSAKSSNSRAKSNPSGRSRKVFKN